MSRSFKLDYNLQIAYWKNYLLAGSLCILRYAINTLFIAVKGNTQLVFIIRFSISVCMPD